MNKKALIERANHLLSIKKVLENKEALQNPNKEANPNYKFLFSAINNQEYNDKDEIINGFRGCVLEGSSRSGKTWSGVDIIIWLCLYKEKNATINVYRETYNEFKTTLYEDFKRRLDDYGLPNPFKYLKEVKSFRINGNVINFLGDGKHGGGCDYAFYNEMMYIPPEVFDQSEMRCRKFWWGDYNPSFTDHYVFDRVVPREDVGFLRTTFLDNKHISPQEKAKILSYEPWLPGSYEVGDDDVYYNGSPISETNQPPPHPKNIEQGTASEFDWKVYGLGLRGAMQGVIFDRIHWIDEFPNIDYTYANDFGFTADPNALVKYAEDENNIWVEPLIYQPIETPEELANAMEALKVERYKPIACDSADKYTGENKGTVEMVKGLKGAGYREAFKISKKKSVMYWILSMKKKKIHVVKNHLWKHVKKERENYRFKEVNGILINQPIDQYNHFFDAVRYGHISHNQQTYFIV